MNEAEFSRNADGAAKKKGWWVAATVILFIMALPVLIPVVLAVGGVALGIILALAGCGLAILLGAGGCVLAGICSLAAVIFCAVVGIGFGLVMVFSTPASGLAVLGVSMLAAGAGILGILIVWQAGRFLIWAARITVSWLGGHLRGRKRVQTVDAEPERAKEQTFAPAPEQVNAGFYAEEQGIREENGHEE